MFLVYSLQCTVKGIMPLLSLFNLMLMLIIHIASNGDIEVHITFQVISKLNITKYYWPRY